MVPKWMRVKKRAEEARGYEEEENMMGKKWASLLMLLLVVAACCTGFTGCPLDRTEGSWKGPNNETITIGNGVYTITSDGKTEGPYNCTWYPLPGILVLYGDVTQTYLVTFGDNGNEMTWDFITTFTRT
jgi:hypothetical protein